MGTWGVLERMCKSAHMQCNFKDEMDVTLETVKLVLNTDLQGTFKLVLQYGGKFAPVSKDGIKDWGSLDSAVSEAEVLDTRSVPFNFNFAGCKNDEEFKKAIDSSSFLVFDKDNRSMFRFSLSDWTGAIDTYGALEEDKSEQEKEKSKVSAEIVGKGGKGLKVKVTWEFASGSTSLSDVMISDLKKELVEGSTSGSKGSCVYEFDIAYNAGKADCYEVDALHMAHGWYRQDV